MFLYIYDNIKKRC